MRRPTAADQHDRARSVPRHAKSDAQRADVQRAEGGPQRARLRTAGQLLPGLEVPRPRQAAGPLAAATVRRQVSLDQPRTAVAAAARGIAAYLAAI